VEKWDHKPGLLCGSLATRWCCLPVFATPRCCLNFSWAVGGSPGLPGYYFLLGSPCPHAPK
jgi:hypothetical protein